MRRVEAMAQHVRPAELVLAATIARRFYLDGRSKIELADEFGLSRFKVARILNDAREQGLVHVDIRLPGTIDAELSAQLGSALGVRRTIVIDTPPEPEASLRRHLAEITADLLTELVTDDDVLGLTWSRTIEETSLALTRLAPCTVVQLAGTLAHPDRDTSTVEVVRQAASVGGGRAYPIYAPLIVPDAATAAALRGESRITEAMSRFEELTKAVIAVGAWTPHHSTVWDAVTRAEQKDCLARGACAEVSGRLLDADGNALRTDLDERVIAITLDQLRAVPEVVAIAAGAGRAAAAAAVVRAGFVDTLVTDASLAQAVLGQAVLGQDHDPPRRTPPRQAAPQAKGRAQRRARTPGARTGRLADG
jgi:DNA-binding transcriptional regulator LsrR (DeoR family)